MSQGLDETIVRSASTQCVCVHELQPAVAFGGPTARGSDEIVGASYGPDLRVNHDAGPDLQLRDDEHRNKVGGPPANATALRDEDFVNKFTFRRY